MERDFACPVCAATDWREHETYRYARDRPPADPFLARRHDILFSLWVPDRDEVELTTIYCRSCGLATYTPRPTADDIARRYTTGPQTQAGAGNPLADDAARANRVATRLAPYFFRGARILDVGGGDGRLLLPIIAAGNLGFLVDYNPEPLPGITRLGATIEDADGAFDAMICSHVLEHVADPLAMLTQIKERLVPGGAVYVEVPSQIWKRIPIARDPVTHVNFFTRDSLERLLNEAGLGVLDCRVGLGAYGSARKEVIRAVAVNGRDRRRRRRRLSASETARRLHPTPWMRGRRKLRDHRSSAPASQFAPVGRVSPS